MQRITITVEPDGTDTIELDGFHGKGCMKLIEELAGGDKAIEIQQKREFFEQEKQQQKARG